MKYLLPISILLGSVIIAFALTTAQSEKSSLEKKRLQAEEEQVFYSRQEKECELMTNGLKAKWDNVISVTYNRVMWECEVTYLDSDTGEITKSRLSSMKTI
jgi:hypothetical protein